MPPSILSRTALCLLVLLVASPSLRADERQETAVRSQGLVAAGTADETPFYAFDSGIPGPAVMVTGGVHGDEPAGYTAAGQIRYWSVSRGKLIVLPRANVKAIATAKRLTPKLPSDLSNLNRNFPKHDQADTPENLRGPLATAIWDLVKQQQPDWLIDLHEGFDFRVTTTRSVGSSVIRTPSNEADAVAAKMLDVVNATIDSADRRFVRLGPPIDGSLARAAAVHGKMESMILETTSRKQTLPVRVRQHRLMVHQLLTHLDMAAHGPDVLNDRWPLELKPDAAGPAAAATQAKRYIAIYNDGGVGGNGPAALEKYLGQFPEVAVTQVSALDVRAGVLGAFDVAIFPGGSGSGQAKAIGDDGRENVRQFVQGGGGYVGICAGSYLATSRYDWGLKIVDAHTVDSKHWARGKGNVRIELTDAGRAILGSEFDGKALDVLYANGPILAPSALPDLPDATPLAIFRSDMAKNGAPSGVMPGTPAAIAVDFGQGRVVCFSPHPEQTSGLEAMVRRAIDWAAGANEATAP